MVALLESDATFRAKQFVCHQLWIIATDRSVPTLEKMLLNKETAEIACYALRTHPSEAASRALREALDRVDDVTKVGIVNIIGDRKDAAGIGQLTGLLKSDNAALAEAAAVSLGTIGTDKAVRAIAEARAAASGKMRVVLTRAWLRGAEYYAKNNRMADALAIYETLFDESEPLLARRSALVGGLGTGDRRAVGLMDAAMDQDVAVLRAAAIANSVMLKGQKVTKKLIATLKIAAPQTQVLIVEALAQRDDPLVKDAVTTAAYSENADVRIAAFNALGNVGDRPSAALLCSALPKAQTQQETDTILASLRRMKSTGVDRAIVDSLSDANPAAGTQLIGIINDRGYRPAVKVLLQQARHENASVAAAAVRAVGSLAAAGDLAELADILVETRDKGVRDEAVRAATKVAKACPDRKPATQLIADRMDGEVSVEANIALMRVLAAVPSDLSLERLKAALNADNLKVRDAAVRAIGQYPDATATKTLLAIFMRTKNPTHRTIALRGCIHLCKTADIGAQTALTFYQQAMQSASAVAEKKLILSGIADLSLPAAIDLVTPLTDDETVRAEACLALLAVAEKSAQQAPGRAAAAARKILSDPALTDLHQRARQLLDKANALDSNPL